ncbi:MAG: AAA family ATPase [Zavarzinella sp.]
MLPPTPIPPDWRIDWDTIDQYPWMQALRGVSQNIDRHAEGDVWTHVHMVVEEMVAMPAWRVLPHDVRQILFLAALFHDIAKPATFRKESDDRISFRGHSRRGSIMARNILWRLNFPFHQREQVCAIIRHHLVPFFLVDSDNPVQIASEITQSVRADWLRLMAIADAKGRICPDPLKLLDQIEHFRQTCQQLNCWGHARLFLNERDRFHYFNFTGKARPYPPTEPYRCEVILLCGLPSSGKDYWVQRVAPQKRMISLEQIRQKNRIPASDPQGKGFQLTFDAAIQCLKRGENFIWNAPHLTRVSRAECAKVCRDHHARLRIVHIETPYQQLIHQNNQRPRPVPVHVIDRMTDRWEVPDLSEAHQVDLVI